LPDFTLDCFGAELINAGLPLERLQALVEHRHLEASVRLEIARAAWTRAVLIGDHRHGVVLATHFAELDPKLAKPLRVSGTLAAAAPLRSFLEFLLSGRPIPSLPSDQEPPCLV